ncbi:30S ribosomal protein S11 [Patescibacteria group bacterium]
MADEQTTTEAGAVTEEKKPEASAVTDDAAPKKKVPAKATRRGKRKKVVKKVSSGLVFVHASYNNTIVTITDINGNVLGWSSAGVVGFRGPKKATPYAASVIVKDVTEKIAETGLREVHAVVRGIGSGREAAVRALHANGINVLSIKDMTPIPHNGCRPRKPRRV